MKEAGGGWITCSRKLCSQAEQGGLRRQPDTRTARAAETTLSAAQRSAEGTLPLSGGAGANVCLGGGYFGFIDLSKKAVSTSKLFGE